MWSVFVRRGSTVALHSQHPSEAIAVQVADNMNERDIYNVIYIATHGVQAMPEPADIHTAHTAQVVAEAERNIAGDEINPAPTATVSWPDMIATLHPTEQELEDTARQVGMDEDPPSKYDEPVGSTIPVAIPEGLQAWIEDALLRAQNASVPARNDADGERYYVDHNRSPDEWQVIHKGATLTPRICGHYKIAAAAKIVCDANNEALRIEKDEVHMDPLEFAKVIDRIDSPAKQSVADRKEQTKDQVIVELKSQIACFRSQLQDANVKLHQNKADRVKLSETWVAMVTKTEELKRALEYVNKLIGKLAIKDRAITEMVTKAIKDMDEAEGQAGSFDSSLLILDPSEGVEGEL